MELHDLTRGVFGDGEGDDVSDCVDIGHNAASFCPGQAAFVVAKAEPDLVGVDRVDIEVDGGVTVETAPLVAKAGANVLVAGSAVFKGTGVEAYRGTVAGIRQAALAGRG